MLWNGVQATHEHMPILPAQRNSPELRHLSHDALVNTPDEKTKAHKTTEEHSNSN